MDALVGQKAAMVARARVAFDCLLQSFCVPVTRSQWMEWLLENLSAFRESMASVRQVRRHGSYRVFARPDLPQAISRLQPQAATAHGVCRSDWACNLQNRTGWHGLKTRRLGVVVVFLIHLHRVTYYIHVRLTSKQPPQCMLAADFDIITSLSDLSHLEAMLADDEVLHVFELQVSGSAALSRGVCITLGCMRPITGLAPVPRRTEACDDDDDPVVLGSDAEHDERAVVDTDEESEGESIVASDTSSDESVVVDDKATAMKQFLRLTAATGVQAKKATGVPRQKQCLRPLWCDEYFIVGDHPGEHVQIRVRHQHKKQLGGTAPMSKQVTPRDYGETRDDPVRSLLVLRGWALWRARQDGWGDLRGCRHKHFVEHEEMLERDVKCLKASCRLLGHPEANAAFVEAVPAIAARLQATGVSATGGVYVCK